MHACVSPGKRGARRHVPGIKGHVSGEGVRGRLAEEEADAAVEAVGVRAGGRGGGRGGRRWPLLKQGHGVGRAVTQRVGPAAQLLAAVRVHAVHEAV